MDDPFDQGHSFDAFLSSMTFAGGDFGCDCDGCECAAPTDTVPPPIKEAVDEHVRKRKLEEPSVFEGSKRLYIRQNRELIKRESGFSLWRLDLPAMKKGGDDPIVEYRNNHRILFVKKLNTKTSQVLSIGKGIIGSAAEEQSRKDVNWKEGESYFLPCSKGIACGWIHSPIAPDDTATKANSINDDTTSTTAKEQTASDETTAPEDDIVIYSLKVSPETLKGLPPNLPEDDEASCWVKKSLGLFRSCLAKLEEQKQPASDDDKPLNGDKKVAAKNIDDTDDDDKKVAAENNDSGIELSEDLCTEMAFVIMLTE